MACLATGDAENVKVDLEFKSVNNHTHVFHVPEESVSSSAKNMMKEINIYPCVLVY